ncbi:coiled-coil domain-containing protein 158-like isoform X2 [Ptychodera flava]|uniref:coiled-coil domain-containing protein 158-like isoform X2 n=1 Tax=Ptychodera flava TaxID=63121 RepID=UPI003969C58C
MATAAPASLNESTTPSTGKQTPSKSKKRQSSVDYGEQIRQLEIIGQRLQSSSSLPDLTSDVSIDANNAGSLPTGGGDQGIGSQIRASSSIQLDLTNRVHSDLDAMKSDMQQQQEDDDFVLPTVTNPLASLSGLSEDRHTVSNLRRQLERQTEENKRLKSEIADVPLPSYPLTSRAEFPKLPSLSNTLRRSDASTVLPQVNIESLRQSYDYSNEASVERRLHESQATVAQLEEKLKECQDICEQQRRHFRLSIEDLQTKLNETIIGRDSVLDLRRKESIGQERMINQLQNTLREFDVRNKDQEEAMFDMNTRMELMQQNLQVANSALSQIKGTLISEEEKRGRNSSLNTDTVVEQSPAMLAHLLQRCFQDNENELKVTKHKLQQLETDLEEVRLTGEEKHKSTVADYKQRIQQMTEEHDKQIESLTERSSNARKQAASLKSQLNLLQEQTNSQVEAKEKHVKDLEGKLNVARQQCDELKRSGEEKQQTLTYSVEDTKSELAAMRKERDRLLTATKDFEIECQDAKQKLSKCQAELEAEREQNKKLWIRDEENSKKQTELLYDRDCKVTEIERLQKLLEDIKTESKAQLHEQIEKIEKEERSRAEQRIQELSAQLSAQNINYEKVQLELELKQTELENLQKQKEDLSAIHTETTNRLQCVLSEKGDVDSELAGKTKDVERLTGERDHYFSLLEERNKELMDARAAQEKLQVQLEERGKNLSALQEQSVNMTQVVEMTNKTNIDVKSEKEKLDALLNEKVSELEEIKKSKEDTVRKLKIREKRVHSLEDERGQLLQDVEEKSKNLAEVTGQKDEMFSELKESRYHIAALTKENDELKEELEQLSGENDKQMKRLVSRLHSLESDWDMAQKALRARDAVDGKAVQVAESMQKEVTAKRSQIDTLQSKIHWLDEHLSLAVKENTSLKEENNKLASKFNKLEMQNEKVEREVQSFVDKSKEQKKLITKLEAALEKAAVKHAAAQALVEQQEQDIARLRLKHQLELKELQHMNNAKVIRKSVAALTGKPAIRTDTCMAMNSTASALQQVNSSQQVQQQQQQLTQQANQASQAESEMSVSASTATVAGPTVTVTATNTQTTQTSVAGEVERVPKPTDDHIQKLAVFSEVGQDLKRLLSEMRTLIAQGQQRQEQQEQQPQAPVSPSTKLTNGLGPHTHHSPKSPSTGPDSFTDAEADQSMAYTASVPSTYYSGATTYSISTSTIYSQPLYMMSSNSTGQSLGYDAYNYSPPFKRPITTSYYRQPSSMSFNSVDTSTRASSPVSDLLTSPRSHAEPMGRRVTRRDPVIDSSGSEMESLVSEASSLSSRDTVKKKSRTAAVKKETANKYTNKKAKDKTRASKDVADECIKRLEQKMKNLSKMGDSYREKIKQWKP